MFVLNFISFLDTGINLYCLHVGCGLRLMRICHCLVVRCIFCIFFQVMYLYRLLLQTYLQSTTVRLEEMRVKRRDAEQWMSHRLLPESLRERIRRYEHYKWQETRGVDEQNLLLNLPKDLRRDIKRHLCLALLMRVSCHISEFPVILF